VSIIHHCSTSSIIHHCQYHSSLLVSFSTVSPKCENSRTTYSHASHTRISSYSFFLTSCSQDEIEDNHKAIQQAQLEAARQKIEEAKRQAEYDRKMKGDLADEEGEKKEGADKKEEAAGEKKEEAPAAEPEPAAK
jgi:hypothetical protein